MDDKASVGKISVSSDSVSTLNSEDFVLVSRLEDETPSTNNGSDDEKTGLKVISEEGVSFKVSLYLSIPLSLPLWLCGHTV
uniref:Rab GTPase-activating protein 1-like n=1 Tax=Sinocyclocheilus anshuiensis TaxID=1608454 RepID=A0A671T2R1_9TELE